MDINNKNIKIYTFKLDIDNPINYMIYKYPECFDDYLNNKMYLQHYVKNWNKCYLFYDVNNNKKKLLELVACKDKLEVTYSRDSNYPSNNKKTYILQSLFEEDNIYIRQIYEIYDTKIYCNNFNKLHFAILNNNLIHILIDNFCKLHYMIDIKVTYKNIITWDESCKSKTKLEKYYLDTITFVIDDTKESNNRKIKFYEHFSDFYRTKNDDMIYKIIQEPIGDGYCLIEEIGKIRK